MAKKFDKGKITKPYNLAFYHERLLLSHYKGYSATNSELKYRKFSALVPSVRLLDITIPIDGIVFSSTSLKALDSSNYSYVVSVMSYVI